MIDLSMSENANLLHGRDYSLHVSQKLGAKIDNQLVKEKLGEIAYHQCKVPTQYKQIQATSSIVDFLFLETVVSDRGIACICLYCVGTLH